MRAQWHALHSQLIRQSDRLSFCIGFRSICERHADLARFAEPGQIFVVLHGLGDPEEKNRILRALVVEAQTETHEAAAARIILLLALWPGLDAIHGRLWRFYRSDPSLLATELVGRASAGIALMNLAKVTRIAATLLRNLERDMRRTLIAAQSEALRTEPLVDEGNGEEQLTVGWPSRERLDVADMAKALNSLSRMDVRLFLMVAVTGASQREAAQQLGLSYDVVRKRYQRITKRLQKTLAARL